MEDFGQGVPPGDFRDAKGPDFVSRLKGYVNVLGPNPRKLPPGPGLDPDPFYVIRRAILLRSILRRNAPQLVERRGGRINVDPGVLRAFLHVREYKHGVRSLESIVTMSMLSGKTAYERSSLPTEAQLNLHVDGQGFLALVQQMELRGEALEVLAEAAHEVFCQGLKDRGYQPGSQTNEHRKIHHLLDVTYSQLPDDLKAQNRANVRDIPTKLARVGYVMVPARSRQPAFGFPGDDLELLAQLEHDRFVQSRLEADWRYAPKTDRSRKEDETLLPWDQLSELQKQKDRDMVRGVPKILARAGYAIIKTHEETT